MNYPELLATVNRIPSFGDFDAGVLYSFLVAEAPPGSVLVEVGNFKGRGLVYLGLCAKAANKGLRVVGVDWGKGMQPTEPTADILRRNIEQHGLPGTVELITATSDVGAARFPDKSVFAAVIDDDHSYEGCRLSLRSWLPKIQTNGLLCGHDYYFHTVFEPVQEIFPQAVNGPTKNFFYARVR